VHLGQDDLPIADAVAALGARRETMMIGISIFSSAIDLSLALSSAFSGEPDA